MEPVPYDADIPALWDPLFLRTGNCVTPLSVASVEDETGDDMTQTKRPTIDESMTAFLRTLSGAAKSASTITAYRTDLAQFARFLSETTCTIATAAVLPLISGTPTP